MVGIKTSVVSAGLIGLSLAACSGSVSSDGGRGGSGVTAAQAAADVSSALCARFDACAPLFVQIAYGDMAGCTARVEPIYEDTLGAPGTGWSPASAEACAKAIPGASCDDTLAHNLPAACHPPAGQLATGAACGDNAQCKSGYCNLGDNGQCGTCAAALGAVGAACYRDDDCAFGVVCVGQDLTMSPAVAGKCTAPGASGASCSAAAPCLKSLACSAATGGACGATVAAGASCSQTTDVFGTCGGVSGNYCSKAAAGSCTQLGLAAVGQPCGLIANVFTTCSKSGTCPKNGGASTTCVAPAADFGNCDASSGPGCESPATCIGGKCVRPTPSSCK